MVDPEAVLVVQLVFVLVIKSYSSTVPLLAALTRRPNWGFMPPDVLRAKREPTETNVIAVPEVISAGEATRL